MPDIELPRGWTDPVFQPLPIAPAPPEVADAVAQPESLDPVEVAQLTRPPWLRPAFLQGWWLRVRGGVLDQDGARLGWQLRVILNWERDLL